RSSDLTEVRAIPLAIPLAKSTPPSPWAPGLARQILVRVTTDDGLVGWGECFAYGATLAVCNVVDDALAPLVVGQDPTQIEQLVDRMHRTLMIWGRRGLAMMAVSGGAGGGRRRRRPHAGHELPVDGGRGDSHRPPARALRPALAGRARVAARGLRRAGARARRPAHADRLRRERGDSVRLPPHHRGRRRRHRAAQHYQGR